MLGIKIDYDKRIYGYDLLRAFAIFCVVQGHGSHLLNGTVIENFPWFSLPHGVDIFFVISGFLIGFSFIVNINKTEGQLSFDKTLNFWKRASLRILPNYYLFLALNYVLVNADILPGTTEKFNIILFITFTQNLFYPFYGYFWESWSLAVQEWFYLLFPLLLFFYTKYFNVKSGVLIFSIFFIVFSILYRYSISDIEYDKFWWDVSYRKVVAARIDSIFYGVIAAWVRYYYPKVWSKYAFHALITGILIFVVTTLIPKTLNTPYTNLIYLSIAPFSIMLWFAAIDKLKNVKSIVGKVISHISILSYAMYLINLLLIQIIDKHYSELLSEYATIKYVLYWLVTIALSYLVYIVFESPISSYGNKILHTSQMMYKRIRENNT